MTATDPAAIETVQCCGCCGATWQTEWGDGQPINTHTADDPDIIEGCCPECVAEFTDA